MKFYDKELNKEAEEISTIIFILIIFIISFLAGCIAMKIETKSEINKLQNIINIQQTLNDKQYVELESFKDAQYMKKYLNLEENKKWKLFYF